MNGERRREGGRHKRGKETGQRKKENTSGSLQGERTSRVIINAKIKCKGTLKQAICQTGFGVQRSVQKLERILVETPGKPPCALVW